MKIKHMLIVPLAALLIVAGASSQDKKPSPKSVAEGEVEAKRLLLLMDRDQSGKVSRQEFMRFMEAEFERMDINKDGELDVRELTGFRLVPHGGSPHR